MQAVLCNPRMSEDENVRSFFVDATRPVRGMRDERNGMESMCVREGKRKERGRRWRTEGKEQGKEEG